MRMVPGKHKLYGSAHSYFTSKVDNILRFQELPYELVERMIHDGSKIEHEKIRRAIPEWISDVYLSPPVADMPELAGNKDTLSNPLDIGRLDPD